MTVSQIHDDEMMMLVCSVKKRIFGGSGSLINDLHSAVEIILSTLDNDELAFRAIDVSGKWMPKHGEFDPWENPNIHAWIKIIAKTELHDQLWNWLAGLEPVLSKHLAENYEGLHESETTQLGEVPASLLAITSLRFVPMYTTLLNAWDLHHGVFHDETCVQIAEKHGRTPEVEELLYTLATKHFNTDVFQSLRETLTKNYENFTESDLFHRIVTDIHALEPGPSDNPRKLQIFSYCPNWPELTEAATQIITGHSPKT